MGVEWEDVWEFPGEFYRGTVQSQGILYNPMGHRGLMGLMGSLMANLDMTETLMMKGHRVTAHALLPEYSVVGLLLHKLGQTLG